LLRTEHLRDLLASDLGNRDRLLVLLAVDVTVGKSVLVLKTAGRNAGWRGIEKINVSVILGRANKLAHVAAIVGAGKGTVVATVAPALRSHLASVANPEARAFAEEAVKCYEGHLYRAAVVLSWVGAVAVLHDHVVASHLTPFNTEATRRGNPKYPWKLAKNTDDLGRMGEHEFLEILTAISVPGIGKNVKEELQKCLKLRNACGHPNTLKLGEHTVAAHIEILILNVFSKF